MITERKRVKEWRISHNYGDFKIRLWVESDTEYGGVSQVEAYNKLIDIVRCTTFVFSVSVDQVADYLFDRLPFANSVEVCDQYGNGTTIHRDWP